MPAVIKKEKNNKIFIPDTKIKANHDNVINKDWPKSGWEIKSNNIGISISHISREFFNYPDTLQNTFQSTKDVGERVKLDTRTDIFKLQNNTLSLGFEYEHESFKNTQFADFSGFVIQGSTRETAITKTIYISFFIKRSY